MKATKTILASDGTYDRLIKETDEDGETTYTVEGLDSRGKPFHFDFSEARAISPDLPTRRLFQAIINR